VPTPEPPTQKDIRLNWARRLKRVFGIEIERCARYGGRINVIAAASDAFGRRLLSMDAV
jgi:hypothetical protein